MALLSEHYYTIKGRQRAVFLWPELGRAVFALEVQAGDEARVEVSHDPVAVVRKGQGLWEPFNGGPGGCVDGATALRVVVSAVDGWVKLMVKQEVANGR